MVENGAERNVDEAEEELQIGTAVDLDERCELVDLEAGLFLACVTQHIGHNRCVVRDIHADGDRDGFAFSMWRKVTRRGG